MPSDLVFWLRFFFAGWGVGFTVYLAVQLFAVFLLRGRRRLYALVPVPMMVAVLVITFVSYAEESNLWPILLIFISPAAAVFLVCVLVQQRHQRKRE